MAEEPLGGFPGGYWGAGATALGAGSDLYSFFENLKRQRQLQALQDILSNPAKLQAYIQGYYQPLSQAAIAATNRDLGANWAVQTGGAPGGAMNQYTADAFAKLESDRYGQAAQQAIGALRGAMGGGEGGSARPLGNLSGILNILMQLKAAQPQKPLAQPVPAKVGLSALPGGDPGWGDYQPTPYPVPVAPSAVQDY